MKAVKLVLAVVVFVAVAMAMSAVMAAALLLFSGCAELTKGN